MFILMVVVFVLGYTAIALEHPLKIDKAASALITGVLIWVIYILGVNDIFGLGFSPAWSSHVAENPGATGHEHMLEFVGQHQIIEHLGDISTILFFLLGAMTIVEIIDQHHGFNIITNSIKTRNTVKLLWIIGIVTFFLSAVLDNLTTTIVMIALLRKLIYDKKLRWFFAGMVIIAANAGGAFSPIGDVTTIMLWIDGRFSAMHIILWVILPSVINLVVPLIAMTFAVKGKSVGENPAAKTDSLKHTLTASTSNLIFFIGVGTLLFVPVFKNMTHLPPYMGILFGLSVMWILTEIIHRGKHEEDKRKYTVAGIIKKVDTPTILFFLGILTAVAGLESAGQLHVLAGFLDEKLGGIYTINTAIGLLSAIVDNVPLVAGTMGMYPTLTPEMINALPVAEQAYANFFSVNGHFWLLLAYCAGTGGSILIIGSAAGVAAMGLEKIDFIWYMKRISLYALLGYIAGVLFYYLQVVAIG